MTFLIIEVDNLSKDNYLILIQAIFIQNDWRPIGDSGCACIDAAAEEHQQAAAASSTVSLSSNGTERGVPSLATAIAPLLLTLADRPPKEGDTGGRGGDDGDVSDAMVLVVDDDGGYKA